MTPEICPPRNYPVANKGHELDDMESLGVIKKVDKPTDWVNSLAVVEMLRVANFVSAWIQDR